MKTPVVETASNAPGVWRHHTSSQPQSEAHATTWTSTPRTSAERLCNNLENGCHSVGFVILFLHVTLFWLVQSMLHWKRSKQSEKHRGQVRPSEEDELQPVNQGVKQGPLGSHSCSWGCSGHSIYCRSPEGGSPEGRFVLPALETEAGGLQGQLSETQVKENWGLEKERTRVEHFWWSTLLWQSLGLTLAV